MFPPGSTLWLVAHELRLSLRMITGRKGGYKGLIVMALVMVAIGVLAGGPLALYLLQFPATPSAAVIIRLDLVLAVVFTMILSQTLSLATLALFERGDLELLLSSPLPPQRVLAARAAAIATTPFLWFTALVSIPVLPLAALGQPRWLVAYPVLAAIAMLAASAGVGLALLLFRLVGARRTREAGQILATLIGAGFFLGIQAWSFLPAVSRSLYGGLQRWALSGAFDPGGPLAWPAQALLGEALPLLGLIVFAVAVLAAMTASLGRRFSANVAIAAGVATAPARCGGGAITARSFRGGVFATILRKELRLLARDPTLLSQVLLRTLYVVPLTFGMLKTAAYGGDAAVVEHLRLSSLAGSITFLAGQVAGSLAWICISAEDAPDLLVCAPTRRGLVRRAKLSAALLPVAGLLAAPVLVLISLSPWVGAWTALGAGAAAVSSALMNLWMEKPMPRRAFRNRREGSAITAMAEIIVGLCWAIAAWLASVGMLWALAPVILAAALLTALRLWADVEPVQRRKVRTVPG